MVKVSDGCPISLIDELSSFMCHQNDYPNHNHRSTTTTRSNTNGTRTWMLRFPWFYDLGISDRSDLIFNFTGKGLSTKSQKVVTFMLVSQICSNLSRTCFTNSRKIRNMKHGIRGSPRMPGTSIKKICYLQSNMYCETNIVPCRLTQSVHIVTFSPKILLKFNQMNRT